MGGGGWGGCVDLNKSVPDNFVFPESRGRTAVQRCRGSIGNQGRTEGRVGSGGKLLEERNKFQIETKIIKVAIPVIIN